MWHMQLSEGNTFSYESVELLHAGHQLELMHVSSVELDEQLMELCSV